MPIKLDPDVDQDIDIDELQKEFRRMAPLISGWSETRANAGEAFELAKAEHDELRSQRYLEFRSRETKVTEKTLEAMIDTDPDVKKALRKMIEVKKDFETIKGFVDGLHAKKDMLVQLGADARKE